MNTHVSLELIDRLVDGSLDPATRKSLLLELEHSPDGWRRCALAFLESQAWNNAIRSIPAASPIAPVAELPASRSTSTRLKTQIRQLGLAASLLTAFGIGWLSRPAEHGLVVPSASPSVAQKPPQDPSTAHTQSTAVLTNQLLPAELDTQPRLVPVGFSPVQTGPELASVSASLRSTINLPWRQRLEREGWRVVDRSGLASIQVPDGHRLNIPVQEVQLEYVGARVY